MSSTDSSNTDVITSALESTAMLERRAFQAFHKGFKTQYAGITQILISSLYSDALKDCDEKYESRFLTRVVVMKSLVDVGDIIETFFKSNVQRLTKTIKEEHEANVKLAEEKSAATTQIEEEKHEEKHDEIQDKKYHDLFKQVVNQIKSNSSCIDK